MPQKKNQKLSKQPNKVLLGLPCGSGTVPAIMVQSLLELVKPVPCAFLTIERQRIDKVRNYFAMQALAGDFTHLLMIDDDNPIPPETLVQLLEDDKDIVAATILSRNVDTDGKHNICAHYAEEKDIDGEKLRMYYPIKEFRDEGPLHRVDSAGTGCILIKREVLAVMNKKYKNNMFEFGDITVNGQRRTMSEDCEFSERASDLGFEIWLDSRIRPVHLGAAQQIRYGG